MLTGLTTAGVWVAAFSLIGIFIRQIGPWKKQADETDAQLRADLLRRVEYLEGKMERQERRHAAEQRVSNHVYKNVSSAFDAMLMMLKVSPERVPEIIEEIEKMRARDLLAEAKEKAILIAAFAIDDDRFGEIEPDAEEEQP